MSSVPHDFELAENLSDFRSNRRGSNSSIADVPKFRYRLRQLFVFVAAACAFLAAIVSMNGIADAIFLLCSCIIAMHVFATAIGNRLEAQADDELRRRITRLPDSEAATSASERSARLAAIQSATHSPWYDRGSTYLPWLPRLILGTMVCGGLAGASLLGGALGHRASPAGIVVGAFSFAVVGGWFAFLCGNFYGVFRDGFREALAEQQKDRRPTDQR